MRRVLTIIACIGLTSAVAAAERETVRDRMWVWAHAEGAFEMYYTMPSKSTITPVDGAKWLGVPNIIFLRFLDYPKPPYDQYAASFRTMKRVMWWVTIPNGSALENKNEQDRVFALAAKMPNITGVFMDDFFRGDDPKSPTDEKPATLTLNDVQQLRKRLNVNGRKLDLGVVVYIGQNALDKRILPHLKYCDIVSLWTGEAKELAHLEDNFTKFEQFAPRKRILLGLYMWDFGSGKPMPLDLMKKQCTLALKWLREGRIEGMIFLATNLCDLNLEAVNWSRSWIAEVGDQPLGK